MPSYQENFAMNSDRNITHFIADLQDPDQIVRIHAATILGSVGEDAEAAVPALIKLLKNGDIYDRKLAAMTLGEIGPAAEDAIPALLAAIDVEDEGLAEMAEEALEEIDVVDEGEAKAA
jgi:HEAT repeat protein